MSDSRLSFLKISLCIDHPPLHSSSYLSRRRLSKLLGVRFTRIMEGDEDNYRASPTSWPPEFGSNPDSVARTKSTENANSTHYSGFGGGVVFGPKMPDWTMRDLTESSRRQVRSLHPQERTRPGAVGMMQAPTTLSNKEGAHRKGHGVYASRSTKGNRMTMPTNVEDAMPHTGSELAKHPSGARDSISAWQHARGLRLCVCC